MLAVASFSVHSTFIIKSLLYCLQV